MFPDDCRQARLSVTGLEHDVALRFEMEAQHVASVVLILDDHDSPRNLRSLCVVKAAQHRVFLKRHFDDELASSSRTLAAGFNGAAVEFDDLPHECQTDAETTDGAIEALSVLHEQLENLRQHFRRDSTALV